MPIPSGACPHNSFLIGSIGLVKADLFGAAADRDQPPCNVHAAGDVLADSGGCRSKPRTCVSACLRQETDDLPAAAPSCIPVDPLEAPPLSVKTMACLARHGIDLQKRPCAATAHPTTESIASEPGTPDIEARLDGSPGWSPKFLADLDRDRRPWASALGILPMNTSIWSMEAGPESSVCAMSHVPAPALLTAEELGHQLPLQVDQGSPKYQPTASQLVESTPAVAEVRAGVGGCGSEQFASVLVGLRQETGAQPAMAPSFIPANRPVAPPPLCLGSPATSETEDFIATASPTASRASEDSGDLADFESLASDVQRTTHNYSNERQRKFCDIWRPAFDNCRLIEDLETTVNRCMADWLSKTAQNMEHLPAVDSLTTRRNKRARRRPDRQLQRLRQREKRNSDEARRIQMMFRIYPKRAVRRAMGESSPSYTGSVDSARIFLSETYERQRPTEDERAAARAHFDACHWSPPNEENSRQLNEPPISEEIESKLARAANTAPGSDGVEYRHLRSLDPRGLVLESMFSAVWRIGIPPCWKKSRTIPIFKKGPTDDYSNFRPISLLPTTYKIFSGIINDRLCSTAMECGWFSHEQKGFLPGVNGVAEHTHLVQMPIEHSKEKMQTLVIA